MAIIEEVLPYFNTANSKAIAGVVRMLTLITLIEPTLEVSLDY